MKSLRGACQPGRFAGLRAWLAMAMTTLAALLPGIAAAAGAESKVQLKFSASDQIYLYISLACGFLAIGVAFAIRGKLMAMSPGDQKMQEVGLAIREGAMAYLLRQVKTMIWFVIALAVGLGFLFGKDFGVMLGVLIGVSFIAGVAASYIAGYVGMLMAVNANMRTANAALTSYKMSLEVSFRAGAVAGLVTVGMGLIGATLIFLFAGADAMKLLVGFGFGGSLAALFMRVGGGIFTKAADVGADLVGKVEAGIPEDDPRNPATIADNVGDNVGDCAGMAADVFESYEVTLVAAIVLGAATAAIFDQATWMKLILFALMARGIGIVASIIGIFMVKGSDDVDADPLKAISGGFKSSALVAAVGTLVLAYFMMGGTGEKIVASKITSFDHYRKQEATEIKKMADTVALATGKARWELNADDVQSTARLKIAGPVTGNSQAATEIRMGDAAVTAGGDAESKGAPTEADNADSFKVKLAEAEGHSGKKDDVFTVTTKSDTKYLFGTGAGTAIDKAKFAQLLAVGARLKAMDLDGIQGSMTIQQAMAPPPPVEAPIPTYAGYTPIDFSDEANPVLKYSVLEAPQPTPGQTTPAEPTPKTLQEAYAEQKEGKWAMKEFAVYRLKITRKPQTGPDGKPLPGGDSQEVFFGPIESKKLDDQISQVAGQVTVEKLPIGNTGKTSIPARLFSNSEGKLLMGVMGDVPNPHRIVNQGPISFYKISKDELAKINNERKTNPAKPLPPPEQGQIAVASQVEAPWYMFAIAILFGIAMAFAIERLTDYYVSTHKAPVQEVAGVSTAGPAPMIIQGFALAAESSVFSVFAIVVALIVPLFLFPFGDYGSFILSFYGIALVGLGLLTTTGFILAMDTFGPISDNAQGVFEMSGAGHNNAQGSKAVQRLDAAGNTTKALTKGFAIATAVVAAVALFHSYIEDAHLTGRGLPLDVPAIFLGMLIGGAAPYLFSAFSINAVGRASFQLINEVRAQFKADPGIMAGTSKPNYANCVAIVTRAAQAELLGPGVLAIALPMAVAFGFSIGQEKVEIAGNLYNLTGAQALGGFLAGAILSGQLMAVLLANSGGIWDNAKKVIEDGLYGGKGTEAHKAGVVCDTVGDPFKDTAGPALNPLIKVMNLVALLLAGVVIQPLSDMVLWIILIVCLGALAFSIWWSKRSSIMTALVQAQGSTGGPAAVSATATAGLAPSPKKRITVEDEPESEASDDSNA